MAQKRPVETSKHHRFRPVTWHDEQPLVVAKQVAARLQIVPDPEGLAGEGIDRNQVTVPLETDELRGNRTELSGGLPVGVEDVRWAARWR